MIDGEDDIVKSAIEGEASAFGLLYNYYQPRIYRFVYLKVGRREEAEDLTHHVFLKAWQNIENFKPRGFPFGSWLYRMARNQVIDFYRTAKSETPLEEVDPDSLRSHEATEAIFDQNLDLKRVKKAIQELKPEHQDVIIMRFVEDLSLKEVSQIIKRSEGAVKLLQHRALEKLRTILND